MQRQIEPYSFYNLGGNRFFLQFICETTMVEHLMPRKSKYIMFFMATIPKNSES